MKYKNSGFTLIELMITTSIVGILAATAIPAFDKYVFDAREVEGTKILLEAYRDQKRMALDCAAGRFEGVAAASPICAGTLRFTELYSSTAPGAPTLMYRTPKNANFVLITGNLSNDFKVFGNSEFSSRPGYSRANQFGYAQTADIATGQLKTDKEKFLMGAEAKINNRTHTLGIDQTGRLLKICDARTGEPGPDASVYRQFSHADIACDQANIADTLNTGGNNVDE